MRILRSMISYSRQRPVRLRWEESAGMVGWRLQKKEGLMYRLRRHNKASASNRGDLSVNVCSTKTKQKNTRGTMERDGGGTGGTGGALHT